MKLPQKIQTTMNHANTRNTMKPEQREEIERLINAIEATSAQSPLYHPSQCLKPILQFARQQLNLRVDGEKFRKNFKVSFERHWSGANYSLADIPEDPDELSRRVLECLITTPEEKE